MLLINDPWVYWGYTAIASTSSLLHGIGAYAIHNVEGKQHDPPARQAWQKWFNASGSAVGWIAGWVVLVKWLGCAGFVCAGEPAGWTIVLAAFAFAGIAGQLPYSLMVSIDSLRAVIDRYFPRTK
jgi:hypothetical protein